jgi:sulfur-carrier protein
MRVAIPSPLRSYTGGREQVQARGATLSELLAELDAEYPGIRFRMIDEQGRIRVHIRLFVNSELARDLGCGLSDGDDVQILCALSGG